MINDEANLSTLLDRICIGTQTIYPMSVSYYRTHRHRAFAKFGTDEDESRAVLVFLLLDGAASVEGGHLSRLFLRSS